MRPKKVVVLAGEAGWLSITRFLLETRGFRVLARDLPGWTAEEYPPDLLVTREADREGLTAAEIADWRRRHEAPAMLLAGRELEPEAFAEVQADFVMVLHARDQQMFLHRVRMMTARKRGPKKRLPDCVVPGRERAVAV